MRDFYLKMIVEKTYNRVNKKKKLLKNLIKYEKNHKPTNSSTSCLEK